LSSIHDRRRSEVRAFSDQEIECEKRSVSAPQQQIVKLWMALFINVRDLTVENTVVCRKPDFDEFLQFNKRGKPIPMARNVPKEYRTGRSGGKARNGLFFEPKGDSGFNLLGRGGLYGERWNL